VMDMVEKVAKAVCLAQWGGYPFGRGEREAWPQWAQALKVARAAIDAMSEPTPITLDDLAAAGAIESIRFSASENDQGTVTIHEPEARE